jgi:peptide/nickel transport system substrate-binding protein
MLILVVVMAVVAATASGGAARAASAKSGQKIDLGATLRISTPVPPVSFDPTQATGFAAYVDMLFDTLIAVDYHNNLVPMLATSWSFSSDGLTLTLHLRSDVKFHDGTPMNADAVVASLEHWKNAPGSYLGPQMANISSVTAVNPTTVEVHLSAPDAGVPALLATNAGVVVDPAAFTKTTNWSTNPGLIGSGPWLVQRFTPLQSAIFERAPGKNWDPKAGRIKTIEVDFSSDQNARIDAVSTNAADMAAIDIGQSINVQNLISSGNYVLNRSPGFLEVALVMNDTKAPFTDPKVRQAVREAIDTKPLVALFGGDCLPSTGIYPPGVSWAHTNSVNHYPFNLKKAKALLAQTSVPNGFTFTAILNAGGGDQTAATAVQAQLAKIGITMNINALPVTTEQPLILSRNYEGAMSVLGSTTSDPEGILTSQFLGATGVAGPEGSALKAVADQASNPSLTQKARAALYAHASQIVESAVWDVPICNATEQWLTASNIHGVNTMPWANIFATRYLYMTK